MLFFVLFLVGEELTLIEDDGRVVQFTSVMCVYIYSGGWVALKERWWQFPLSKLVSYGLATRGCMILWHRKRTFGLEKFCSKSNIWKRLEFQNLTFQFPFSIYGGFAQQYRIQFGGFGLGQHYRIQVYLQLILEKIK